MVQLITVRLPLDCRVPAELKQDYEDYGEVNKQLEKM